MMTADDQRGIRRNWVAEEIAATVIGNYFAGTQAGWRLPGQLSMVSYDDTNPVLDSFG